MKKQFLQNFSAFLKCSVVDCCIIFSCFHNLVIGLCPPITPYVILPFRVCCLSVCFFFSQLRKVGPTASSLILPALENEKFLFCLPSV